MAEDKRSSEEQPKKSQEYGISLPAVPPLPEGFQGGKYANHLVVGVTQWEFYFDFWRIDIGVGAEGAKPSFVDRIIISPHNVKGFIDALKQTVESFEREWNIVLPNMRDVKPRSGEE